MHRVAFARPSLRSSVSKNIRCNSTEASHGPRKPAARSSRWDSLVIPSRQEILSLKQQLAEKPKKTDISYLEFESNASLAARLARPTIEIEARKQQKAPPPTPDALESDLVDSDTGVPKHQASQSLYASPAERRRAEREEREAVKAQREERKLAKQREREESIFEQTKQAMGQLKPFEELQRVATSVASSKPAVEALSPAAARRRAERLLRDIQTAKEATTSLGQSSPRSGLRQKRGSSRRESRAVDLTEQEEDYQVIPSGEGRSFEPEFNGPGAMSLALDLLIKSPTQPTHWRRGGNYSNYLPQSANAFANNDASHEYPPAQHVQIVLSHRPDVSIPQRKQLVELVEKMTRLNTKAKPNAVASKAVA